MPEAPKKKKSHCPSKAVPDRRPQPDLRRCLGLGEEHFFHSGSFAERICGRCRSRIDGLTRSHGRMLTDSPLCVSPHHPFKEKEP